MTTLRRCLEIPVLAALVGVAGLIYLGLCLGYAVAGFIGWCGRGK